MKTKRCAKCGKEKPLEYFQKLSGGLHGHSWWCRLCNIRHGLLYFRKKQHGYELLWQALDENEPDPPEPKNILDAIMDGDVYESY